MSTNFAARIMISGTCLALSLFGFSACGGNGASTGERAVSEWSLGPEITRIGSLFEGPAALSNVPHLVTGPEEEVFVLQDQEGVVKVFTRDGMFLRVIASQGEGPGELQLPSRIGWSGDLLWILDRAQRRVSFFQPDGTFVSSYPYPEVEGLSSIASVATVGPSREPFILADLSLASFTAPNGELQPRLPLLRVTEDGGVLDTIATLDRNHARIVRITQSGGAITSAMVFSEPFGDFTIWDASQDGRIIATADRTVRETAAAPSYVVTSISSAGDTVFSTTHEYEPTPIPSEMMDSVLNAMSDDPSKLRDELFIPEIHPPVSNILVGTDGSVWIARENAFRATHTTWEIWNSSGELTARMLLPVGFQAMLPLEDEIWGVETDDFDVPYVVGYRILR